MEEQTGETLTVLGCGIILLFSNLRLSKAVG